MIKQTGFTLIELMIVLTIVGLLTVIAVPVFQSFIVRSQVSEVFAIMSRDKLRISEYVQAYNQLPVSTTQANLSGASQSQYLLDVRYETTPNERIVYVLGNFTQTDASGEVYFIPTTNHQGIVTWRCQTNPDTSVGFPSKYLPHSCRS